MDVPELLSIYDSVADLGFTCVRPYWKNMGFFPKSPDDLSNFTTQFCYDSLQKRKSSYASEASVAERFLDLHAKEFGKQETEYFVCWVKGINKLPISIQNQMYKWRSVLNRISRDGMYAGEPIGMVAEMWKFARPARVEQVKLSLNDEAIAEEWFAEERISPVDTINWASGHFAFFATCSFFLEHAPLTEAERFALLQHGQAIDPALSNPLELFVLPNLLRSRIS